MYHVLPGVAFHAVSGMLQYMIELFMRNWHETERRKAAERRAKAAAAPSTVGISKRPGGGGRGGGGEGTGGGGKGGGGKGGRGEGRKGERHAQETEVWVRPSSH